MKLPERWRVSSDDKAPEIRPSGSTAELFEQAVHEHSRRLLAIARAVAGNRFSPEDIVQQALMNLYQHRDRYDWNDAGALLRRSVVNEALRLLRQPKLASVEDFEPGTIESPDAQALQAETVQRVRKAIDRLPANFRAALVLCEYEKMSYADIAKTLDASIPQVKTWLHRGRKQLAEMLRPHMT